MRCGSPPVSDSRSALPRHQVQTTPGFDQRPVGPLESVSASTSRVFTQGTKWASAPSWAAPAGCLGSPSTARAMLWSRAHTTRVRTMGVPNEPPMKRPPTRPDETLCEDFVPDWRSPNAYD